jgi:outer membrane protein OmpA-like peptidoglycan-associated protein
MKIQNYLITLFAGCALPLSAQQVEGVQVTQFSVAHRGEQLVVDGCADVSQLRVKSGEAVVLTPVVTDGTSAVELSPVAVYGRKQFYYYLRNYKQMVTGRKDERTLRRSWLEDTLCYVGSVPYEAWMNRSRVVLKREVYHCCRQTVESEQAELGSHYERSAFKPQLVYPRPATTDAKLFQLEGTANICFGVGQSAVKTDYGNNAAELARISATIDSVKTDRDITITGIRLKGYASPEGSYASNARLAEERTRAIMAYVNGLYHFNSSLLTIESEAEDWEGVSRYLAESTLPDRDAIAELIATVDDPDVREQRIRSAHPDAYRRLLADCYPVLRRTTYRVNYTVRKFTDVEEIKRIFEKNPYKLSLNELFLAAQSYPAGSDEAKRIYAAAALLYPNDPTANLMAANVDLANNRLDDAEQRLQKAGDSPETNYAWGVLRMLQGQDELAIDYLKRAQSAGIAQASEALDAIALSTHP